jgi:hypothetical protein
MLNLIKIPSFSEIKNSDRHTCLPPFIDSATCNYAKMRKCSRRLRNNYFCY